jgi:hypothetical protein
MKVLNCVSENLETLNYYINNTIWSHFRGYETSMWFDNGNKYLLCKIYVDDKFEDKE